MGLGIFGGSCGGVGRLRVNYRVIERRSFKIL